jgi:3D (Asp-Asp-Asp) domain-containing protein
MNGYLINFLFKLTSFIIVSTISLFSPITASNKMTVVNNNINKIGSVETIGIKKHSFEIEDPSRPKGVNLVISEGQDGYYYVNENNNEIVELQQLVNKVTVIGTGDEANYKGVLTGYGPDCEGCSLVGNVACFTKEKTKHSLIYNGLTYNDSEYGEVRILAAALNKFPCGTIIYVDNGILKPFYGIVLDTGATMRNAWNNEGRVWIDLAFATEKETITSGATSYNTKFKVERFGW